MSHVAATLKPSQWNVGLGAVPHEWKWAWVAGCLHLPLWEGGGVPRILTHPERDVSVQSTPTFLQGPFGLEVDFGGTSTSPDTYDLGVPPFDTEKPWAIECLCVPQDQVNENSNKNHFWGMSDASSTERIALGYDDSNSDAWKILSNGATPGDGSSATFGELTSVILAWDGGDFHLYLNNVLDYSVTPSGTSWLADLDTVEVGSVTNTGEAGFEGQVLRFSMYPFVPRAAQRAMLASEPFGMLQRGRPILAKAPAAPAVVERRSMLVGAGF